MARFHTIAARELEEEESMLPLVVMTPSPGPSNTLPVSLTLAGTVLTSGLFDINYTGWDANLPTGTRADTYLDIGDGNGLVDQGGSVGYLSLTGPQDRIAPTDGRPLVFTIFLWDSDVGAPPLLDGRPDASSPLVTSVTIMATAHTAVIVPGGTNVFNATGVDNYGKWLAGWMAAPAASFPADQIDQTFSTWAACVSALNNSGDNQGRIYAVAGGVHASTDSYFIENASNFRITTDPLNPAIIDGLAPENSAGAPFSSGSFYPVAFINCDNGEFDNFIVKNFRNHGISCGQETVRTGSSNMYIHHCEVSNGGKSGIKDTENGSNNRWESITGFNFGDGGTGSGEFAYFGSGNNAPLFVTGSSLRYCRGTNCRAEFVDVKRNSRGIIVEYNWFTGTRLNSQGGITYLINELGAYDAQGRINNNIIEDVQTYNANGNFIVIGNGYVDCFENIGVGCVSDAIAFYEDGNGPNRNVDCRRNVFTGYGRNAYHEQNNNGPSSPLIVNKDRNLLDDGATGTDGLISNEPLLAGRSIQVASDLAIN